MSARWVGIYNVPGAVTLSGLAFAMTSCAFAISGRFELAVIGLIFAGLCDLFDGVVARRSQLDEEARGFGVELDSVVDMASYASGCRLRGDGQCHGRDPRPGECCLGRSRLLRLLGEH